MYLNLALLSSDTFNSLVTTITPIAASVISAVCGYVVASKKEKSDSFKSIIEANEAFRKEVKEDLEKSKQKITELSAKLVEYQEATYKLKEEILTYKMTIADLNKKINEYEIMVKDLQEKVIQNSQDIKENKKD